MHLLGQPNAFLAAQPVSLDDAEYTAVAAAKADKVGFDRIDVSEIEVANRGNRLPATTQHSDYLVAGSNYLSESGMK